MATLKFQITTNGNNRYSGVLSDTDAIDLIARIIDINTQKNIVSP